MHIAVNTRYLIRNKMEGIGYFTYESMIRITRSHPEHKFTFIFDRPFDQSFIFSDNITPVVLFPPARHPFLWHIWYQWSLPPLLRKLKPDLFISPDGYLPLSTSVKTLAVIHDLNFEMYPMDMPFLVRQFFRQFKKFAKKADRIATVSGFTKNDIINRYAIDADKIDIVYNGVNEKFQPVGESVIKNIREKYSEGQPYFLFVGALHQRKNIANLLRSFELFKNENGSQAKLLLTGKRRWWTEEMEKVYLSMKFKNDVIFTGRLDENDLYLVTASAFASVYVSTFEGFGIPIIEAMRAGVPVITSNVTSMPEVAGDAALLCDPFNPSSIAKAMSQLWKDDALRKSLIDKGLRRQKDFSWDKTAEALWKCIVKAAGN